MFYNTSISLMAREKRSQFVRNLNVAIGAKALQRRAELGLSRADIERRSGVPARVLGDLENGRRDPDSRTLIALADALGVDIPFFFAGLSVASPSIHPERPSRDRVQETEALVDAFLRIPDEEHRRQLVSLLKACVKSGRY